MASILLRQTKVGFIRPLANAALLRTTESSRLYAAQASQSAGRTEKTVNTVNLLGRVGADPQLRGSADHPVVTFSLATHTNYKYENGDWAQRTDWHRIVVFRPNLRDTVMDYLKKGQRAMVQGKITYGEITDQQGNQRPSCSIIADDVIFFRESSPPSSSS